MGTDVSRRRHEADQRADQIRLGFARAAMLYAQAVLKEDWRAMGYAGVTDWAAGEFGPDRFSADRRREIVALLTQGGYTVAQIAAATGASRGTVNVDQQATGARPLHPSNRQRAVADHNAARQQAVAGLAAQERVIRRGLLAQWADREQHLLRAIRGAELPLPVLDDLLMRLAAYREDLRESLPGQPAASRRKRPENVLIAIARELKDAGHDAR